jgi:hypothetical protein
MPRGRRARGHRGLRCGRARAVAGCRARGCWYASLGMTRLEWRWGHRWSLQTGGGGGALPDLLDPMEDGARPCFSLMCQCGGAPAR